jgi:hypothetical protein
MEPMFPSIQERSWGGIFRRKTPNVAVHDLKSTN